MKIVSLDYRMQHLENVDSTAFRSEKTGRDPFIGFVQNIQSQSLDLSCKKDNASPCTLSKMKRADDFFLANLKTAHNAGFLRRSTDKANRNDYIQYLKARKIFKPAEEQAIRARVIQAAALRYPLKSQAEIDVTGYCYKVVNDIKRHGVFTENSVQRAEAQRTRAMALITINMENRRAAPRWK